MGLVCNLFAKINAQHFESESLPRCCVFNEDEAIVDIRKFWLITVTANNTYTLSAVNTLNCAYKYIKYVFDQSDNTITPAKDVPLAGSNAGDAVLFMIKRANSILNYDNYPYPRQQHHLPRRCHRLLFERSPSQNV